MPQTVSDIKIVANARLAFLFEAREEEELGIGIETEGQLDRFSRANW